MTCLMSVFHAYSAYETLVETFQDMTECISIIVNRMFKPKKEGLLHRSPCLEGSNGLCVQEIFFNLCTEVARLISLSTWILNSAVM